MSRDLCRQCFLTCTALLLITAWMTTTTTGDKFVSNLDSTCLRCLCHASTLCNATFGCSRGFCGPYFIPRDYWKDAGFIVLQDDDPDRDMAFIDCVSDMTCAQRTMESYLAKWGRDCNQDGVTDCDDYARTHFNGREDCSSIDRTNYWRRYESCRPGRRGYITNLIFG
ncbi:lysozyme-like isoform X2 [Daktulosphaira vitifoliae]|uniref:lysozyme-like isoform X2 n=1 Tax=Daktulosphaira vitifoliae TaxID=58002 RepID=UPI0021AAF31A|nr:lysozyme-like isoform X2 [Daktulosphaira vitifoliae]